MRTVRAPGRSARLVDVLRLAVAARCLLSTPGAARSAFGPDAGPVARTALRVLGARQAVQAVVATRTGWRALSAGVDVLHAASMLPVVVCAPRRAGRFAGAQLATAAVLAALELAAGRRG